MDVSTLEGWLWDAACQVRGPLDAPKFKDYILPLIFLKRLSDVFEDEFGRLVEEIGDEEVAREVVEGTARRSGSTSHRRLAGRGYARGPRGLGSTSPMRCGRSPGRIRGCRA